MDDWMQLYKNNSTTNYQKSFKTNPGINLIVSQPHMNQFHNNDLLQTQQHQQFFDQKQNINGLIAAAVAAAVSPINFSHQQNNLFQQQQMETTQQLNQQQKQLNVENLIKTSKKIKYHKRCKLKQYCK